MLTLIVCYINYGKATDRTSRNKYTIREENPRGFKEHTGRIATKENNLLKLFML